MAGTDLAYLNKRRVGGVSPGQQRLRRQRIASRRVRSDPNHVLSVGGELLQCMARDRRVVWRHVALPRLGGRFVVEPGGRIVGL